MTIYLYLVLCALVVLAPQLKEGTALAMSVFLTASALALHAVFGVVKI